MSAASRGRLRRSDQAPQVGETSEQTARLGDVVIEHILSGALASPVDYDQPHDEWVVLLEGAAVIDVGDERIDLTAGDWLLLPAHQPHRLVETRPGSSWLAVHCPPASAGVGRAATCGSAG